MWAISLLFTKKHSNFISFKNSLIITQQHFCDCIKQGTWLLCNLDRSKASVLGL